LTWHIVFCATLQNESATHTTRSDLVAIVVIAIVQCLLAQLEAVSTTLRAVPHSSVAARERAVGSMGGQLDQWNSGHHQ
jgi:hypothetical protein